MKTNPLTGHAAKVLAMMRLREAIDRAEARELRLAVVPVTRAQQLAHKTHAEV